MRDAARITKIYGHTSKFLALLVAAELNASNAWECEFVNNMRDNFEKYGERMTMTPLQRKQFNRIAKED